MRVFFLLKSFTTSQPALMLQYCDVHSSQHLSIKSFKKIIVNFHSNKSLFYNHTPLTNNSLVVFKAIQITPLAKDLKLYRIWQNLSPLPTMVLERMVYDVVTRYNWDSFFYYLQYLFITLPVPKHRLVFLFLRRLFNTMFKKVFVGVKGFSIVFKGKLAVTGNKRKRGFKIFLGQGNSTNFIDTVVSRSTVFRTTTGVIGCTVSIIF